MRLDGLPTCRSSRRCRLELRRVAAVRRRAPPGAGKTTIVPLALLDAAWRGDGRIVDARAAAPGDAGRGPADGRARRPARRRAGRLPDPRRAGDRAGNPHRGAHRGRADPPAAERPRAARRRRGDLRRGPRAQPDHRPRPRPDARRRRRRCVPTCASWRCRRPPTRRGSLASSRARRSRAAPVIAVAGRAHPVDVRWLPRQRNDRLEGAVERRRGAGAGASTTATCSCSCPASARSCAAATVSSTTVGAGVDVRPLAGALSADEQDLALAPSPPGRRRVVLATDIAETSLTVEGVRVVVDSGLARAPRFDPATGMTRLTTVSISRDSADQRAGRAGRTEPGVAYRLWSKIEHGSRPAHRAAEIAAVDLSGLALEVAAWGTPVERAGVSRSAAGSGVEGGTGPAPRHSAPSMRTARSPTIGRAMVALPLHPRLARIVATRAVDDGVRRRRGRRRARRPARTGRRAARRPRPARRPRRRADRRRSRRPRGAAAPRRPGRRPRPPCRRPVRPGDRRPRRHRPAAARRVPGPAGGAAASGPVPAAHRDRRRGWPTTIRWRTPTSSSPPTSTAGAPAPASAWPRRSTRADIAAAARRRRRASPARSGTPIATISCCASSDGSTPSPSARRSASRRLATTRSTPSSIGCGRRGWPCSTGPRRRCSCGRASRSCARRRAATRRPGPTSRTGRCSPPSTRGCGRTCRGAIGRDDLRRLDVAMLLRGAAAVAARRRAGHAGAGVVDAARRSPGGDRLHRRPADRVRTGAGRVRRDRAPAARRRARCR